MEATTNYQSTAAAVLENVCELMDVSSDDAEFYIRCCEAQELVDTNQALKEEAASGWFNPDMDEDERLTDGVIHQMVQHEIVARGLFS